VRNICNETNAILYKYNNKYYVLDGHHRISNQILNGAESVDARVYEPNFSIIGEKGATALDKAEEATTRLDNLGIAKEMETWKEIILNVITNFSISNIMVFLQKYKYLSFFYF
jgi:hypothetical protein